MIAIRSAVWGYFSVLMSLYCVWCRKCIRGYCHTKALKRSCWGEKTSGLRSLQIPCPYTCAHVDIIVMSRQGQTTLPFAVAKSASDGPVKPTASVVLSKSSTGPIAPEVVDVSRTSPVLQSSSTIPFPAPAESGATIFASFPPAVLRSSLHASQFIDRNSFGQPLVTSRRGRSKCLLPKRP